MKTFKFSDLAETSQIKAVKDYIEEWEETHEKNDMEYSEAQSNCEGNHFIYDVKGNFLGENE